MVRGPARSGVQASVKMSSQTSSWLQEVLEALQHRRQTQTQETLELNELVRGESFTLRARDSIVRLRLVFK